MPLHVVRLPDVGEGIVQAELVEWLVEVGDSITSESPLAEVLTEKATVEISSPVTGIVVYRNGEPGEVVAVGSDFIGIEVDRDTAAQFADPSVAVPARDAEAERPSRQDPHPARPAIPLDAPLASAPARPHDVLTGRANSSRPRAAPAVRRNAIERGIDLRVVQGSGPAGRILQSDLDAYESVDRARSGDEVRTAVTQTTIRGVRRAIATRMTEAWRTPHITYVDEVDLTELEKLRTTLNERHAHAALFTVLPFVVRAVVVACGAHPRMSSTFDDESAILTTHDGVHVGIATQTEAGLVVPVVRHAVAMSLQALASEITRVAAAARSGRAAREDLAGSTITVTSLGRIGGLVTTPILNHPEVAIVGVNQMKVRPMWNGTSFVPRTMMNLSSSFDHRIIDGWDAASFVQHVKELLETPALLFMNEAPR
jgi:2-oxoisovalerate dehydrogenase E2 component (dihydrolipoyl transacylase)